MRIFPKYPLTIAARLSLLVALFVMVAGLAPLTGQVTTFTSSGTFRVPAGITSITVECWGGGGGGGSVNANKRGAGGGGGGAYARSTVAVTPNTNYLVSVGAGGSEDHSGGNSSFNTSSVVAAGGGGAPGNSTTPAQGGSVAASTGTVRYAGGNGAAGDPNDNYSGGGGGGAGSTGAGGNASGTTGGTGTSLYGGNGGTGVAIDGNGQNGSNYGGGGSGGIRNDGGQKNGGRGAPGLVVVHWCPTALNATLALAGETTICKDAEPPMITFTGSGGIAPYTFTYNINGGPDQTITTTTGNSVTLIAPTSTAGTFQYQLSLVIDTNYCSNVVNRTVSLTVAPLVHTGKIQR